MFFRKKHVNTVNSVYNNESALDQIDTSWGTYKGKRRCSEVTTTIGFVHEVTGHKLPFGGSIKQQILKYNIFHHL